VVAGCTAMVFLLISSETIMGFLLSMEESAPFWVKLP